MQPYKFISGEDPTDEQLAELMRAVAVEVRERAKQAEAKYKAHFNALLSASKPLELQNKRTNDL